MSYPTVTLTLSVGGTYSSGDYVGESGVPMEFLDCGGAVSFAGGGGSGWIVGGRLVDGDLKSVAAELWVFDYPVTPPDDNAAWSISDADAAHTVCVIPFSTYYASALNSVALGKPDSENAARYLCAEDSHSLYGCLVTRGAPVYVSGHQTIGLGILKE
jgi:hypothetical protein